MHGAESQLSQRVPSNPRMKSARGNELRRYFGGWGYRSGSEVLSQFQHRTPPQRPHKTEDRGKHPQIVTAVTELADEVKMLCVVHIRH